jgi:hypothetical protein
MAQFEHLGSVSSRSGILLVIDTGYLNLWSHNGKPVMPSGVLDSEEATERANSFVDVEIVGPDAEKAGRLLDMSWHPLYVYDQPPVHRKLQTKFDEVIRAHQLQARLKVIPERISHRRRVDLALEYGKGAGEIQFHGICATTIGCVPRLQAMPVLAERSASDSSRWKQVFVKCRPHTSVARSEMVGNVAVDYARLLITDIEVLGSWKHEQSLDGRADYVFWGLDAETVARALDAPTIGAGEFGWLDLPLEEAEQHGLAVQQYRESHSLKLAGDFRPHSHQWQVMTPTRVSATESATVEIDGVSICNFMTTWGDGLFAVHRELSQSGELVQIRIELEGRES